MGLDITTPNTLAMTKEDYVEYERVNGKPFTIWTPEHRRRRLVTAASVSIDQIEHVA